MQTLLTSAFMAGFFVLSGANTASEPVAAEEAPSLPSYTVSMTSYNAVPGQTDEDPMTTASGLRSNPELIAARSRDLDDALPFGTIVKISRKGADTNNCRFSQVEDLIGYRVIGDVMNARMHNKVDILLDQNDTVSVKGVPMNPSRVFGICDQVTIEVVGYMEIKDVPKTQAGLVRLIELSKLAEA